MVFISVGPNGLCQSHGEMKSWGNKREGTKGGREMPYCILSNWKTCHINAELGISPSPGATHNKQCTHLQRCKDQISPLSPLLIQASAIVFILCLGWSHPTGIVMQRSKVPKLKVDMWKVMTSGLKDEGLGTVLKDSLGWTWATVERRRRTCNHVRGWAWERVANEDTTGNGGDLVGRWGSQNLLGLNAC